MNIILIEFKTIPGFPKYEINKLGEIRNKKSLRILKDRPHKDGYRKIGLMFGETEKQKTVLVHRLVALTFIPNPKGYPVVNHKDEVKTNNHVDNLEWCSIAYNINYGTAIERKKQTIRAKKENKAA